MPTGTTTTAGARELEQLVSRVIVDMNQMAEFEKRPLILSRGEGVYVWDVNGRRYFDGVSGVFVVNVGHGNRRVIDAMKEQLELITFAAPTIATNDRMLELAEAFGRLTPDGMDVFKFSNSGSEAIEVAFKIARQYHGQTGNPGRYKILSRYSSYHGATLGAMGATGLPQFRVKFEPMPGGFVHFPAPRFDGCGVARSCPPCDLSCADCLDLAIRGEGPATVAAVVLEPVMNMAGSQAPPDGYLRRVRDICDEHGVLLIYDEIVTGFGRLGHWFAADRYGVWPDLLVVGKGMTSGLRDALRDRDPQRRRRRLPGRARRGRPPEPRPHVRRQSTGLRRSAGGDRGNRRARPARQRDQDGRAPANRARVAS